MQNIPNAENDKFKVRRAFIPAKGKTLLVADYDTLEMRLLACASMEESMIETIRSGRDIHMGNATIVFGKIDNFDYEEIANAKKIDKKVKNGELPESALTERMHQLLRRRVEVKAIGFGRVIGRSKIPSKRRNLSRVHCMATPCCIARCSVSTRPSLGGPQQSHQGHWCD